MIFGAEKVEKTLAHNFLQQKLCAATEASRTTDAATSGKEIATARADSP
jgi:hypothetical protein